MSDLILCPRCNKDTITRSGEPILPPQQRFSQDTFGPTRLTPVNQQTRYPVHRIGTTPTNNKCDWHGSFTGHETELLLMQIVIRGKTTDV